MKKWKYLKGCEMDFDALTQLSSLWLSQDELV